MKYINHNLIESKNRKINVIEAPRGVGKSYGLQMKRIKKWLKKQDFEIIFVIRTIKKKEKSGLYRWFKKVLDEQFQDYQIFYDNQKLGFMVEGEKKIFAHCIAMSEIMQEKNNSSYNNVNEIILDEYQLEETTTTRYINGFKEPELLINLRDTIDRNRGIVKITCLGNTITAINPYHIYFNLPIIKPDTCYLSKEVCYYRGIMSDELIEESKKDILNDLIMAKEYGKYKKGEYIEENDMFILNLDSTFKHYYNLISDGVMFGLWYSMNKDILLISLKHDIYCKINYALDYKSLNENYMMINFNSNFIKFLTKMFKKNRFRYENITTKKLIEKSIIKLIK